jgi:3-oxoacyl-[acyl-carrier protein] reductase
MKLGIEGKTALITGAGRGIGRGICEILAREGALIVAVSRGSKGLNDLRQALGNGQKHKYLELDLTREDSVSKLIEFLQENKIEPNIVVNNAGGNLGHIDPLKTSEGWREVMWLNLEIAILINEFIIPQMQLKKWGRICHVSSVAALENQGPPAYCAAKAALNAYVRSMGRYVSKDNVILTSVMPGAVFTEGGYWDETMQNRPEHVEKYLKERMAIQRFGKIEEITEAVAFLCSDLASFCVGTCLLLDGGQGRTFYPQE